MKPVIFAFAACSVVGIAASAGAQTDDVQQGRAVAARACATCHLVDPAQQTARADGIPALRTAMKRDKVDAAWLRAFLNEPHQRMPPTALMRDDREALISYLLTLKQQ